MKFAVVLHKWKSVMKCMEHIQSQAYVLSELIDFTDISHCAH